MINNYLRHKLQLPVSDMTREIDKRIKIIFSKRALKEGNQGEIQELVRVCEYQIKELFNKHGHLLK